ncbi:MetQ/NlpA family ABC transporter substrate-binding protein [Actinoalloteichus caeruleus]|uniref:Lipoprotein n=1 Tax=Actinoalloteichus caeruleus DSM 43889 TaxID=1120930 RepID=A0ABT1JIU7_ACTCY|nr:MetQ/NlpA family ABC transporter substrate-binding protein [Actinoalloteichus caeruleus]MCP2332427.1 D-methionine transport system substrate-binding protein [Actinoalloteichus caeruleus DSM 43889]
MRHRSLTAVAIAAAAVTTLAACGNSETASDGGGDTDTQAPVTADGPLRVGASVTPHAEILNFVQEELAADAGLEIEVVEFTDYVQPNTALRDGSLEANYFQTIPYLEQFTLDHGGDYEWVEGVHIEPLGLYSESVDDVDDLPDEAVIGLANDPANLTRGLRLLADSGLITLAEGTEDNATELDVEDNPKNLRFQPLEAAQLPRSLADTDASVINGNYAIDAGLNPTEDAILLEDGEESPYANGLVTLPELVDDERIQQLTELLRSEEVREFIEGTYQDGSVVPAF